MIHFWLIFSDVLYFGCSCLTFDSLFVCGNPFSPVLRVNLCSEDLCLFLPGLQALPAWDIFLTKFPGQCRYYKFELSNPCEGKFVVMNSKGKVFFPSMPKSRLKLTSICISPWVGPGNFFFSSVFLEGTAL